MIQIRHALASEKRKVYEWLYLSDTTSMHIGPPTYPHRPVPTWETFLEEFEAANFIVGGRPLTSVIVIENEEEELGNVAYSTYHVREGVAELDIWLKSKNVCGKGYGVQALKLLKDYLTKEYGVHTFIIRPAVKNIYARKAYGKAGFKDVTDKSQAVNDYLREEYIELYGDGDYGLEETAFMVCHI